MAPLAAPRFLVEKVRRQKKQRRHQREILVRSKRATRSGPLWQQVGQGHLQRRHRALEARI